MNHVFQAVFERSAAQEGKNQNPIYSLQKCSIIIMYNCVEFLL